MALIKCSECGKEISDKAKTCPSCGNPLASNPVEVDGKVEIEQTSKKWKKRKLWALFILFLALIAFSNSVNSLGWLLVFVAIVVAITANIGAWWTNG